MIHQLPARQCFFRVTRKGWKWPAVLSGRGAFHLSAAGNRYNVVLQQAAYASDSLTVAVTEWAYYLALDWHERIAGHHVAPVNGPLVTEDLLWAFTLTAPISVVDVEAVAASLPWAGHVLVNPARNYAATQRLANLALTRPFPGYPPPHAGLKVPAVRSRLHPSSTESNFVFFRLGRSPAGQRVGKWRLRVEFLDLAGDPVGPATARVDWARPRSQLLPPVGGAGAGLAAPAGCALSTWQPLVINHL
jgi:RES domain